MTVRDPDDGQPLMNDLSEPKIYTKGSAGIDPLYYSLILTHYSTGTAFQTACIIETDITIFVKFI